MDVYDQAIMVLAERRLAARKTMSPALTNPQAWLAKVADSLRREHNESARHIRIDGYTPERLADRLEQGPPRPPSRVGWQTSRSACHGCLGNGWVDDHTDGAGCLFVRRCPVCWEVSQYA